MTYATCDSAVQEVGAVHLRRILLKGVRLKGLLGKAILVFGLVFQLSAVFLLELDCMVGLGGFEELRRGQVILLIDFIIFGHLLDLFLDLASAESLNKQTGTLL